MNIRHQYKKIFFLTPLILSYLLLISCSALQQTNLTGNSKKIQQWKNHEAQLLKITKYQIRGTFTYLVAGKQVVYSNFFWEQIKPDNYYLIFINQLCSNTIELNFSSGRMQITNNQKKYYIKNNIDKNIQKLTGIKIPLKKLRLWMLGLSGDATNCILDDQYRLQHCIYNQDGITWRVNYLRYGTHAHPSLPVQLEIKEGEQIFKLKINNWIL
ncbi:lipoprotein insertase outer membrane protein LolB [Candidatus Profftia sp. (ex Adelges kitamiensis)]|uniref:lipoprotein insertase outer membrane protein LolB n=1 Tax=Candidatus Profftia sp. (ex Adelges kitamiensis) TaxID=2864218 RepID=UPI001CE2F7C9|nr:lipoprotein insertase outer membrane protein LolB [Candidatus Profftia sp. (ex Adelges kitamiensis)]